MSGDFPNTREAKALNYLQSFMKKIAAQDNRATAFPYFYVVRTKRWLPTEEGCSFGDDSETKTVYTYIHDCHSEWESKEEYIQSLIEDGVSAKEAAMKAEEELTEHHMASIWEESNVFFTEEGYNEHLRQNKHNLREPHSYVKHAWRNPEIKELFEALSEITGVKYGKS